MSCLTCISDTSALDLTVARGAYKAIDFELTETVNGLTSPVDLTGRRVFIFVKIAANPESAVEFFSYSPAANGVEITDPTGGKFTWVITDANSNRQARTYLYTVGHDDGSGGDVRLFEETPNLTITNTAYKAGGLP